MLLVTCPKCGQKTEEETWCHLCGLCQGCCMCRVVRDEK